MLTKQMMLRWMQEDNGSILRDRNNPNIITGYVTFTKERASMALENNAKNRKVNSQQVNLLLQALKAGLWDPQVSKLNFDENMVLSDGQHRLYAFEKYEKPVRCLVTIGVKTSAQGVTDRRGNRNLSNDLEIIQVASSKQVAALTRVHAALESGLKIPQIIANGQQVFSHVDAILVHHYYKHEKEIQWMKTVVNAADTQVRRLKIPKTVLNVLAPILAGISEDDARVFWEKLGKGIVDGADDPIRLLRLRLEASAANPHSKLNKLTAAALIIKTWNLYEAGMTCRYLRYRVGGANPETFPEIFDPYAQETSDDKERLQCGLEE